MLASLPTTDRAWRHGTFCSSVSVERIVVIAARSRPLLPSGTRRRPSSRSTLIPRATTGSPTTILAGAAWRPISASPSAASCACTCARVPGGAGRPPAAAVCRGSITMCSTHSGGRTVSSSETPVPRCRVPLVWGQLASALPFTPASRPLQGGRWRRLRGVEGGVLALHPGGHQRGDALETVRRKGAPEAHPLIDHHARLAVLVPPDEALYPPVCPLHRAEPVGRLGIRHPGHRAWPRFAFRRAVPVRVDNRQGPGELLYPGEDDCALALWHHRVNPVVAPEARVSGDAGLGVMLEPGASRAVLDQALSGLQDDVAGLQSAWYEGDVASGLRHPPLPHVRGHCRRRRAGLIEEAGVMEG
eukprot:638038-Pleurochrysis_carterae.AAC.2